MGEPDKVFEQPPVYGNPWTRKKLAALEKYLRAYTTALKNQPFQKIYIDAFAGTGQIARPNPSGTLFDEASDGEDFQWIDGSARIALKNDPPFDQYIFIEKSEERCRELNRLKDEFPHLTNDIKVLRGDANEELQRIGRETNWRTTRAVAFLDPYGLQVNWSTVQAIAKTRAMDLWLLFPLGVGVNRMLKRSGEISDAGRARLTALFGTEQWQDELYKMGTRLPLFPGERVSITKASIEDVGTYFNKRLQNEFAGAASPPGVLRNSTNNPLYLLCFAVGNARAVKLALRIATDLIKELR